MQDNVLGYYVFDNQRGWLQEDEQTWAFDFAGGAEFTSLELADAIGKRQSTNINDTFYVFACMGSVD